MSGVLRTMDETNDVEWIKRTMMSGRTKVLVNMFTNLTTYDIKFEEVKFQYFSLAYHTRCADVQLI